MARVDYQEKYRRGLSAADKTLFSEPRDIATYVEDVRVYYKYCEYFFANTIVGTAISKLAMFSVDGLTIKSESVSAEKRALQIIRRIRLKESLVLAIRDLLLYGVFYLYPMQRIRKSLKCKSCGTIYGLDDLSKMGKALYRRDSKGVYRFTCSTKSCQHKGSEREFILKEDVLHEAENINIALWSPNRMSIAYNSITGDKQYIYEVDGETKRRLSSNDHFMMCTTPEMFISAAVNNKKLIVSSNKIFVYEAPTLKIHGIPMPPLVRTFYELGLRQKYMRANKTIAEDCLIPLRILFPVERGTSSGGPMTQTLHLRTWKDRMQDQLDIFAHNKSHVPIMPVETGVATLWGDGKLLATDQEMRANMQDICGNMEVPIEFMYGGATWSRQNVSAMVLQNRLKMLVSAAQDTVSFIEDAINRGLDAGKKVSIKLTVPELVEAFSKMGFLDKAHDKGELSSETWFKYLGEDFQAEQRFKAREVESSSALRAAIAKEDGMVEYERAKSQINLQVDQRKSLRRENIKDSIANASIEKDVREQGIRDQARMQLIQMQLQREAEKSRMAQEKVIADQQAEQQLKMMREQMLLQESSQARSGREQMKQQLDGMKQQAIAEIETQELVEEHMAAKEMQATYDAMPPEIQQQIQQMPPEEQQAAIQQYAAQMQMQEVEASLSPEQAQEYQNVPDNQKEQYLQEAMAAMQQQEQIAQDPNAVKAQLEQSVKYDPKKIEEKAAVYNRLTEEQRRRYEEEMMQEDTDLYARVKQTADEIATYEYVSRLLNATDHEVDAIWQEIAVARPEIVDEVYSGIETQLQYMQQALKYALQLNGLKSNKVQWKEMIDEINTQAPAPFKKMIYNEYAKLITGQSNKESESFRIKAHATAIAGALAGMDENNKRALLSSIQTEAPDLYSRVMEETAQTII